MTDRDPEIIEDSAILDLKYSFAEMLIVQKKKEEAELISKEVWKKRQVAPESEEAKESHRQLCSIWRTLEKYRDAENMHRNIYHREPKDSWALENGDAVCRTIAEQGDYEQAQLMQDSVWKTRQKHDGQRHDLTIRSGLQRITFLEMLIHSISSAGVSGTEKRLSSHRKKGFECELEVMLYSIWNTRLHPEPLPGILDAGHRLGNILFRQAKYADAEVVFLDVWEGRKCKFGAGDVNAMVTGSMLGKALLCQQKPEASSRAVTIFRDILHTRQTTLKEGNVDTLSSGSYLAQAYLSLEDWLQAEAAYRWVVEQKAREYGPTAPETIEPRWNLGQSLFKQGGDKLREAEIVLNEVYRQWNDSFPNAKATLECGHMLAELLQSQKAKAKDALRVSSVVFARREASMERDVHYLDSGRQYGCLLLKREKFPEAEKVLKAVWEHPAKGSEQEMLRLKCGHLYGQVLSKQQKCSEAKEILEMVAREQESIFPAGNAEVGDTSQLLREVSERCKEMEKERGKRDKHRRVRW